MLLEPTPDQEFFRDTTARFLGELVPVAELRRRRDDPVGFDLDYWRRGAELGWTSLLVDEAHGGGSISGNGVIDLTLVAHEFGRHAAPGPLTPTNVVAAALSASGSHQEVLGRLLAGTAIATWCRHGVTITVDGDELVLDGTSRPVESAAAADHLLVSDAAVHVLVPASAAGISTRPMKTVDLTRRFDVVRFDGVRVPASAEVAVDGERLLQLALVIAAAESVGAMEAAFGMTVEWAFDRYSFGRPLASYQALKHRFADMKAWLEGAHAIADAAAAAVAAGSPAGRELASAASAFIGDYGGELMQDCVQLHGGIGVTFEHDLHLYMRRLVLNRTIHGSPATHRQRVAGVVLEREREVA